MNPDLITQYTHVTLASETSFISDMTFICCKQTIKYTHIHSEKWFRVSKKMHTHFVPFSNEIHVIFYVECSLVHFYTFSIQHTTTKSFRRNPFIKLTRNCIVNCSTYLIFWSIFETQTHWFHFRWQHTRFFGKYLNCGK